MLRWIVAGALGLVVVAVALAALLLGRDGSAPPDVAFVMETHDMHDPDAPGKHELHRLRRAGAPLPADARGPDEDHARQPEGADPGAGRPDLRPPAGRADPRRRLSTAACSSRRARKTTRASARWSAASWAAASRAISDGIERVATFVWKGKAFDRDNMVLRNLIEDRKTLEAIIGDDADDIETIEIQRKGFLSWSCRPARSGCCSRPSSIAARACSTAGANRSSSTTPTTTTWQSSSTRTRTTGSTARACASATRSAWCGPASISAGPTSTAPSS